MEKRAILWLAGVVIAGCVGESTGESGDGSDTAAPDLTATGGLIEPEDPSPTTSGGPGTSDDTTTSGTTTTTTGSATTSGATTTSTTSTTTTGGGSETTTGTSSGEPEDVWEPEGCPSIYSQHLLPTFELEISSDVWKALKEEWQIADDNNIEKHPLKSFTYGDTVITTASIRLRGNSSHWPTQGKMQFEIEFNTFDDDGRFQGLKHLLFDCAEYNRSYLRDRLALSILRDAGVAAPCANNARLEVNGEYYGLFTSIEKVDSEFLERHFEFPRGNLYKRGGPKDWRRKNNEEDGDESDIEALKDASDLEELLAVMNLEQAILEWATEAVITDRDGAWGGGLNLYVYNDPLTGFNVIPWDLDDSFTRVEPDIDPVTWKKEPEVFHGRPYYDIALDDPEWFDAYIDAIDHVLETAYQVDVLQQRIDDWSAQIAEAAADDPGRPFTLSQHLDKVQEKREFVATRAAFLKEWLQCWKDGGENNNGVCKP